MSKEKEILDKELSFNYGDELDKIQNHISTLRFVAISSVNSLEEQGKEIERLNNIINEALESITYYDNDTKRKEPIFEEFRAVMKILMESNKE